MKKQAGLLMVVAMATAPVFATQSGGFAGLGTGNTTVAQAKKLPDDTWVTLRGNIERRIGKDDYIFRDTSGTITVDIDKKRWDGQMVTVKDTVEIQGEVDKGWNAVEIDVKQISKLP